MATMTETETRVKPTLTPRAKEIVATAIQNIKDHPEQRCMAHWFEKDNGCGTTACLACGTTACLAGHIALAAGLRVSSGGPSDHVSAKAFQRRTGIKPAVDRVTHYDGRDFLYVADAAAQILGKDNHEDLEDLFVVHKWPSQFQTKYRALGSDTSNTCLIFDIFNKDGKSLNQKEQKKANTLFRKRAALTIARLRHYLKTGE